MHCHERARPCAPCALLAASAVFAALIDFAFAHLLLRLDPKREPVFAMQPDDRITSHPVELVGSDIIPHARGHRARIGGRSFFTACFSPGVDPRSPPPGSGEAVALSFAGMGLSG